LVIVLYPRLSPVRDHNVIRVSVARPQLPATRRPNLQRSAGGGPRRRDKFESSAVADQIFPIIGVLLSIDAPNLAYRDIPQELELHGTSDVLAALTHNRRIERE